MKNSYSLSVFIILLFSLVTNLGAQKKEIFLKNPSFEDKPRKGERPNVPILGWTDCGRTEFPAETPPDIHPVDFWQVTMPPSHGTSYLGMVVRHNDTWESLSQRLTSDLEADKCYLMKLDLARSPTYVSGTRLDDRQHNFVEPAVLRVWGTTGYCGSSQGELLAETPPIENHAWDTYQLRFTPRKNYRYIVIQAFFVTPTLFPYNGHVLVDNIRSIKEIGCDEEYPLIEQKPEEIIAEVAVEETPAPKPKPKKDPVKTETEEKAVAEAKPEPIRKSRFLSDNDVKKLKKGQVIKIEKLYFEADTSSINVDSYEVLDDVYYFLKENKQIVVEIGGHTNGMPSHQYCDDLSTNRAREVATYLIRKGIPKDQITFKGYGKRSPIASNYTKSGRKKNQRVEIKILSVEG